MYYYSLQPPYFLLFLGFFIALTSGLALSGTLKLISQKWTPTRSENPTEISRENSKTNLKQLVVPFIGITGGICLFMSSGLEIFGFPSPLALGIGLPLSLLTCLLIWLQLGSLLDFAQSQGMQSLDLDS